MNPTIVPVDGAFAESASWNNVVDSLATAGHRAIAAAIRCGACRRRRRQ